VQATSPAEFLVVSHFENYAFLPVVVSEAQTISRSGSARASRIHPENVSLTMAHQGVLPKQRHLLPQQSSRQKCMEENSLKLHGKGQILGMLRLALIPASPGLARRSARQV
jgi:hypothetical protein